MHKCFRQWRLSLGGNVSLFEKFDNPSKSLKDLHEKNEIMQVKNAKLLPIAEAVGKQIKFVLASLLI